MPWWLWMLAGLGLLLVEVITPGGFFAVFFGLAGLLAGALAASGLVEEPWIQWLVFTGLAVTGLLFFRRPLLHRLRLSPGPASQVDTLVGESALVLEDVPPGGVGKAEMRGTPWSARTAAAQTIKVGQRARVVQVDGLTLWLLPS